MNEPTLDLVTKYGTLTIIFLDPAADTSDNGQVKEVAAVRGELTIRGETIKVSTRVGYAKEFYAAGKELESPRTVMREDYRSSYNRRGDGYSPLTPGQVKIVRGLVEDQIRTAYENNVPLQHEAKVWRAAYNLSRAEENVEDLERKLRIAQREVEARRHDLIVAQGS